MAEDKPKKKTYPLQVTPTGVASWPKLTVPDPTYHKYQIGLRFPKEEGLAFLKQFEAMDAENLAEAQEKVKGKRDPKTGKPIEVTHGGLPYKLEFDKTTGEETGFMTIQFGTKESWKDKAGVEHKTKVILQDSKARPLPPTVQIGGGSLVKVAFIPSPYFIDGTKVAGVTFRLIGVQLVELRSGFANPFGEVEGGYVADDEAPADAAPAAQEGTGVAPSSKGNF